MWAPAEIRIMGMDGGMVAVRVPVPEARVRPWRSMMAMGVDAGAVTVMVWPLRLTWMPAAIWAMPTDSLNSSSMGAVARDSPLLY